jgi:hypothetical protein
MVPQMDSVARTVFAIAFFVVCAIIVICAVVKKRGGQFSAQVSPESDIT